MPKALVIGASGLLGSRVTRELLQANFKVFGTSHSKPVPSGCIHLKTQYWDFLEIHSIFPRDFDLIVNCAGLTNVDVCELQPEAAWQLNASIPLWLSDFAIRTGAHLIHVSTDHYESGTEVPRTELTPVYPTNQYGFSKMGGEAFVMSSNLEATILRTNFFGLSESNRNSLLDFLVSNLLRHESILGFADVIFSPIGVTELARTIVDIAKNRTPGLFNAAGPETLTKFDFAQRVANQLGIDSQYIRYGLAGDFSFKAPRPRYLALDSTRLFETLQRPILPLEKMLSSELTVTLKV